MTNFFYKFNNTYHEDINGVLQWQRDNLSANYQRFRVISRYKIMKTSKWLLLVVIVIIFSMVLQISSGFKITNTNISALTTTIERMKRSQPKNNYKVKCHQSGTGKKFKNVYFIMFALFSVHSPFFPHCLYLCFISLTQNIRKY